jgi:hypothetical protein
MRALMLAAVGRSTLALLGVIRAVASPYRGDDSIFVLAAMIRWGRFDDPSP